MPRIDPERRSGCDTCVRRCPHGTISLQETDQGPIYLLRPADYSGCGICVDAYRDGALQVLDWAPWGQARVPPRTSHCRSCGAPRHRPDEGADGGGRYPVCRVVDHDRLRYRILARKEYRCKRGSEAEYDRPPTRRTPISLRQSHLRASRRHRARLPPRRLRHRHRPVPPDLRRCDAPLHCVRGRIHRRRCPG